MGKSGSYRQVTLDRRGLRWAQTHEERKDKLGAARSVSNVPPLIWSRAPDGLGEISVPEDWEPGNWDSTLIDDFERHVSGARYDKRALVAGGKIAAHAFLQFPTALKLDADTERLMLARAVKFVNQMHGGDAVFHARLDRDEAGKHGVDVFFAPRYEKTTGRKKDKVETWVSLRKFEKEAAKKRGFGEGPRERGRMFQTAWFDFLRDPLGMGLDWVERGKEKLSPAPDRLEPEVFKLTKDREALAKEKAAFSSEKVSFQRDQKKKQQDDERQKLAFDAERKDLDVRKQVYLEARSVFLEKSESERHDIAQEQHRQDYQRKVFDAQKRDFYAEKKKLDIEKLGVAQEKIRIEAANQSLARREAALGLPEAVEAGLSGFFDGRITGVKAPEEGVQGWKIGFAPGEDVPRWRQVLGRFWDATARAIEPFQRLFQTFKISLEQRAEMARPIVQKSPVIRQNLGFERD